MMFAARPEKHRLFVVCGVFCTCRMFPPELAYTAVTCAGRSVRDVHVRSWTVSACVRWSVRVHACRIASCAMSGELLGDAQVRA